MSDLNIRPYPIGEAARKYAEVLKPALLPVAKALGYRVGAYYGQGFPRTILRPLDPRSRLDRVTLNWKTGKYGVPSIVADVRTKARAKVDATPWGQAVTAMTFGVPQASGSSANAKTLLDAVRDAIADAIANLKEDRPDV